MRKIDFINLLKLRCGNRRDADFTAIVELEATLMQQTEIEANGKFCPWFLESEWASASTEANEERLPLPEVFLREIEGQVMRIQVDGSWVDLDKKRFDEMLIEYGDGVGVPKAYDLVGNYIVFKPTPDNTYPIKMRFYQRDTAFNLLADTDTNNILTYAQDWLLACTGRTIAAEHLHDDALAQKFEGQKLEAFDRVYGEHEAREHANRVYRMEG